MNLRRFLEARVERHPDKPFLFFESEVLSYQKFNLQVNRVANGFLELGVGRGDRVCLKLPNIPEFLFSWLALAKIGAIMVPLDTSFKEEETRYIINHCQASGLIIESAHKELFCNLSPECQNLKWLLCTNPAPDETKSFSLPGLLAAMPGELRGFDLNDEDVAQIAYTSGTTGFPKGAVHTHRNFTLTGEAFTLCADLGQEDRVMIVMPLFHTNAQYYSTMGALAAEAGLILIRRFSARKFWDQAVYYQATEFNFVGAIGSILCKRSPSEFRPNHRIKTAYGASVTPGVYKTFTQRFGIGNVIDGYGLTEVPRVCQNPIGGLIKMRSIGLPAKHPDPNQVFSQVKIVSEGGKDTTAGEPGEIMVKSPVMMKGYYKDPERTAEAIEDGWFHTGDIGYRDEEGYIFFIDRKKDIIRRKGKNLSPAELEAVINVYPKVAESAVVAVPSELGEDEILACIVPASEKSLTPEEVIDWCRSKLADFKLPRYVQFRKSLPKTATARITKYRLKDEPGLLEASHDMRQYLNKVKK